MKGTMLAAILLIAIGIISLVYQGISYTTNRNVINLGPIKADVKEEKTIPLPPIIGALALAGGIALLVMNKKNA